MRNASLIFAAALVGCTANVIEEDEASGSSSSTSVEGSSTSAPIGTTGGGSAAMTSSAGSSGQTESSTTSAIAWETEGADEGYATTGGCGFTCPQPPGGGGGGGVVFECSIVAQDCARGEKCAPWANDGGWAWNATRCVPLHPSPVDLGEACSYEGSYVSGIDSCDVGLWCGPETAEEQENDAGSCHQLCSAGVCPSGTQCVVPGYGGIGVCQEECDPLGDPCPATQACMPSGFSFACHVVNEPVSEGEWCEVSAHCGPGSACVEAAQCGDVPCCAPYCDLDAPACAAGQTCVGFGSPLPAFENVGFCSG